MLPTAEWPQPEGRRLAQEAATVTRGGAEERSELVAVVVGEGCAAPRRAVGGGIGSARCLDALIRGSVGHAAAVTARRLDGALRSRSAKSALKMMG